jgi:hypothetical protein
LDINTIEMTINTIEPTMESVNESFWFSSVIKWMLKTLSVHCSGGKNMKTCFLHLVFVLKKILGIVGYQIELEKIFSLVGILTNLMRCRLQSNFLNKLIFINKNWPNDSRIGYKSPSSLVDFVETDLILEEELEKFEVVFEKDKVVKL